MPISPHSSLGNGVSVIALVETSDRLAAGLIDAGLAPRDRVVLYLPNMPEIVRVLLALVTMGAIPVMALPSHRLSELRHFVRRSRAVGYFIPASHRDFDFRSMADRLRGEFSDLRHIFVAGRANAGQRSLAEISNRLSLPGDLWNLRPKAGQTISFHELIEFLAQKQIAKFKLPERLEVVERFSLSPAGKILRRELRALIERKLVAERAERRHDVQGEQMSRLKVILKRE